LKWKGSPTITVSDAKGKIIISDCVWDLKEVSDESFVHFQYGRGTFECINMIVSSFNKPNLKFFDSSGDNYNSDYNTIGCTHLIFMDTKINIDSRYFHLAGGTVRYTDSVCLILFIFILFFIILRYLKMLKVEFSI
jgi:hypothetical protein